MKQTIYLDYNATAPVHDSVVEAVAQALRLTGNPSSVHAAGRQAKALIEEARIMIAALVDCRPRDIVFTSGGSESNNAVVRASGAKRLLVSTIEHESLMAAATASGLEVTKLPVDQHGILLLDALERALENGGEGTLVSVLYASNETGSIQPVVDIIAMAKNAGARVHVDAVQALGKVAFSASKLGADYMSISAHKIGGPKGIGAVVAAPTAPLAAFIAGGGQELGRRGGTENLPGIAGFGAAALEMMAMMAGNEQIEALRDSMESELERTCPNARIMARGAPRLGNTSAILLPGVAGETQVMHMDLAGICVSSGSACSSGKVKASRVLAAMGVAEADQGCSIRVSLGWRTTEEDIAAFIKAYRSLYDRTAAKQAEAG